MITDFACPICKGRQWESVETFCYDKENLSVTRINKTARRLHKLRKIARLVFLARPESKPIHSRFLNPGLRRFQDVLFSVWFPGEDKVTLTTQYCGSCGFGCYTPRPEEKDVKGKYEYLWPQKKTDEKPKQNETPELNKKADEKPKRNKSPKLKKNSVRAERIYNMATGHVRKEKLSVLDYGGGDGRMLVPFIEAKHDCHLVDYSVKHFPGVEKIGDELSSVPSENRYDVIICSHVLEHLTDPLGLLKELKKYLHDGGIIYAEVPMELRCGFPIESNPITHCNFFAPASFQNLFSNAGYRVSSFEKKISNYDLHEGVMMWLVAEAIKSEGPDSCQTALPCDTKSYLYPSRWTSIYLMLRLTVWRQIRATFKETLAALKR